MGVADMTEIVKLPDSDLLWRQACLSSIGLPPVVDLKQICSKGETLRGAFTISFLSRLIEGLPQQASVRGDVLHEGMAGVVFYELTGYSRLERRGFIRLKVQCLVDLLCQRCMKAMVFAVNEDVEFDVFESESSFLAFEAQDQLEPDGPESILALKPIELAQLIEDQIILAVPYVPKHQECGAKPSESSEVQPQSRQSPFAVLQQLKGEKE